MSTKINTVEPTTRTCAYCGRPRPIAAFRLTGQGLARSQICIDCEDQSADIAARRAINAAKSAKIAEWHQAIADVDRGKKSVEDLIEVMGAFIGEFGGTRQFARLWADELTLSARKSRGEKKFVLDGFANVVRLIDRLDERRRKERSEAIELSNEQHMEVISEAIREQILNDSEFKQEALQLAADRIMSDRDLRNEVIQIAASQAESIVDESPEDEAGCSPGQPPGNDATQPTNFGLGYHFEGASHAD